MKITDSRCLVGSVTTEPTKYAETGIDYQIPKGVDEDEFMSYVKEFVALAKIKGLTVRQAQILFQVCSEYIFDCTLV